MDDKQTARCSALWDSFSTIINGTLSDALRATKDVQNAYYNDLVAVIEMTDTERLARIISSLAEMIEE